jgi:hypothetical protein
VTVVANPPEETLYSCKEGSTGGAYDDKDGPTDADVSTHGSLRYGSVDVSDGGPANPISQKTSASFESPKCDDNTDQCRLHLL